MIGLGLNVAMPVVARATRPPGRNAIVAMLLGHWLPALAQFDDLGLEPFLARYAAFDALAGRAVRVEREGGWREGEALGLAADGALRVRVDGVEQLVHAGEVSVRATT